MEYAFLTIPPSYYRPCFHHLQNQVEECPVWIVLIQLQHFHPLDLQPVLRQGKRQLHPCIHEFGLNM